MDPPFASQVIQEPLRYCSWEHCTQSFRDRQTFLSHLKQHVLDADPVDEDSQGRVRLVAFIGYDDTAEFSEFESYLPPRFEASTSASASRVSNLPLATSAPSVPAAQIAAGQALSNETTAESTISESVPTSMPALAEADAPSQSRGSPIRASGELPPPDLSCPPSSIPLAQPIDSQLMTQFSQPMDTEQTQDAPSPPAQQSQTAGMDVEGEGHDAANSSALAEQELVASKDPGSGTISPSKGFALHFSQLAGSEMMTQPQ